MDPQTLINILNLITAAAPGVVEVISVIKNKDGSTTVIHYVDAAQAEAKDTMAKILAWQAALPAKGVQA